MPELLAGIDVGTSAVKVVMARPNGLVVARLTASYPTHTAPGGVVEQDPEAWWQAVRQALHGFPGLGDVVAVGVTGQMQDLVVLAGGRAVRPALLYSDLRAADQFARLQAGLTDWEAATGNQQDASSVAAKIAWLAEHENEELRGADHLLLGAPGHLVWRMTGRAVCDPVTASTTGLLDIAARDWSETVLAACGVRRDQLPQLATEGPVGNLGAGAAAELGLTAGIPVVHALGDAGATTDGLVGSEPGSAYLHLGTTGWVAGIVGELPDRSDAMHTLLMPPGGGGGSVGPGLGVALRIGAVLSAGGAAGWARDTFFTGKDFRALERELAPLVADATHRPLCLPGLAGERTPVRDADLRGTFVGVDPDTDASDLYLATLTGVAMGLRHAADRLGLHQQRLLVAGGGARSGLWRQVLADVFGVTVVTGDLPDPGAWSAVRAAAGAVGIRPPRPLEATMGGCTGSVSARPSAAAGLLQAQLPAHRALYDAVAPVHRMLAQARHSD